MKVSQHRYLETFGLIVIALAVLRLLTPGIARSGNRDKETNDSAEAFATTTTVPAAAPGAPSRFFNADGTEARHRVFSVSDYHKAFPDENDVQLASARRNGVRPVADLIEAERRKNELVYVGANPYFHVDNLRSSIPYLVPGAATLLQDIGRAFFDSLTVKGVPLHKIRVTSVMRSKDDVAKLSRHNQNAKANSAHLYGTTFDIAQNRYITIENPDRPHRRAVRNDTLKWILSEVLNDMRRHDRCYVKYETRQGCFHVTVK